jgi:two-component system, NarL family, sensor histidine kinase UhpB
LAHGLLDDHRWAQVEDRQVARHAGAAMTAQGSFGARLAPRHPAIKPGMSLAWRVVLVNSAVMLVACLALALGPATVSSPIHERELFVLLAGAAATMGANVLLVRRAFAPLLRLTAVMHRVDPLAPGVRVQADGAALEVRELADAFNDMLERLESERRDSAQRAVRAQEAERRRLARELHDELGQSLTGVLLQIDQASRNPGAAELDEAREGARRSLDEVRRIARDLRPDLLVELGLPSALHALATRLTRQSAIVVERRLHADLPQLSEDAEVVVYRVAQEALTNVARHSAARRATIELAHTDGFVTLTVDDDGRGVQPNVGNEARGITGMRERALLVHGRLRVGRGPERGTRVRLEIPVG